MRLRACQLAYLCLVLSVQSPAFSQQQWEQQVVAAEAAYLAGEYDAAEAQLKAAVAQLDKLNNPAELSTQMQNLAFILYLQNRFPESEAVYQKALAESEVAWGTDSLEYAENLQGIIRIQRRQGRFAEAEPLIQRMIEIRKKRLGNDHKITGHSVLDLAVNYERQGKFMEADIAFSEALQFREKEFGKNSKLLIPYLEQYAKALRKSAAKLDARIADITSNGSSESPPPDPPDAPSDRPRFLKSSSDPAERLLPVSGVGGTEVNADNNSLIKRIARPNQ